MILALSGREYDEYDKENTRFCDCSLCPAADAGWNFSALHTVIDSAIVGRGIGIQALASRKTRGVKDAKGGCANAKKDMDRGIGTAGGGGAAAGALVFFQAGDGAGGEADHSLRCAQGRLSEEL